MKKTKSIVNIVAALFIVTFGNVSCNDDFLTEVPLDFVSPENLFTTKEGFESAVIGLHAKMRNEVWGALDGQHWFVLPGGFGTDYGYQSRNFTSGMRNNYSLITSTDAQAMRWWRTSYSLIKDANAILTRLHEPTADAVSAEDKLAIEGQARFFRAFAYRILVYLYGDVPLVVEESREPETGFVRAPKAEVMNLIVSDLEFASNQIAASHPYDGFVTKAAADHLLSEMYIANERWDDAIAAASRVIDNSDYELMTERFGQHTDKAGDVYWDLFRIGNQNRSSGNKEALFVLQFEWPTPGGGSETHPRWPGHVAQRAWGPAYFQLRDPNGSPGMTETDSLGRPAGWIRPTFYLTNLIWQDDWNDMRNSRHNIKRDFWYNNPNSEYFGQKLVSLQDPTDSLFRYFPYFQKIGHPEGHADGMLTGRNWRDLYVFRLAETYLLRAEAKLGKGDNEGAAADINVVRARAMANPITASDVDIDFILDERARELVTEEFRLLTLMRLGKLVERVQRYNPIAGPTIAEHHKYWPIPQEEIDLNFGARLTQNDGY
ncbi:Starch-binding associating with outer membrane [Cyclobacterium xiamenense]|uniref:Starch-binding associating with outer membrane n=1 Tax=Cyclobacterium xiamenense TaxID=1297121 RepID=A0A1H7BT29_9BACT|nr:RagB/SusD family nutrient uptake outer membrane protein [Cyclobacterium xiamenense]SEJ77792.1 Starch-binding associating with outer membrane [Cyclobacterium xiamenense]